MATLKEISVQSVPSDVIDYIFEERFKGFYLPVITNVSKIFMIIQAECSDWKEIFKDFIHTFPFLVSKSPPYSKYGGDDDYYNDTRIRNGNLQCWAEGDIYFMDGANERYNCTIKKKKIDIKTHQKMI